MKVPDRLQDTNLFVELRHAAQQLGSILQDMRWWLCLSPKAGLGDTWSLKKILGLTDPTVHPDASKQSQETSQCVLHDEYAACGVDGSECRPMP